MLVWDGERFGFGRGVGRIFRIGNLESEFGGVLG